MFLICVKLLLKRIVICDCFCRACFSGKGYSIVSSTYVIRQQFLIENFLQGQYFLTCKVTYYRITFLDVVLNANFLFLHIQGVEVCDCFWNTLCIWSVLLPSKSFRHRRNFITPFLTRTNN